jgi:GNAT superfamily N-acetyltransferase/2'-5' RNA ligase
VARTAGDRAPKRLSRGTAAAGGSDAAALGTVYHSTPFQTGFPYDEWMHLGTRRAAEDRSRQIDPEDYGLPADAPVTMHSARLRGRVYPRVLTDEQATSLTGSGFPVRDIDDGLPSGEGYHVFPYRNEGEDAGSVSYLAHRSAIIPVRSEVIPRRSPALPRTTALGDEQRTAAGNWSVDEWDDDDDGSAWSRKEREHYDPSRVAYEHDAYPGGEHWFSAQDPEEGEVGHAHVFERQGPGGPHVEVRELRSYHEGHGIGSRLLDNVAGHFKGSEIRLKPHPLDYDEDSPTTEDLEDYYRGRGFEHYRLKEGDPYSLGDWMSRQASHEDGEDEEPYDACYYCQREHNPHEHEESQSFVPEWDQVLPGVHSIHRVLPLRLPEREHALVHDPATPPEHAAGIILRHLAEAHPEQGHMHWTSQEGLEHNRASFGGHGHGTTSVVLHARAPGKGDIDDDPSSLIENQVHPYGHPEYEVPIAPGADVHLTGMSWARARTGEWGEDNRWHEGPEQEWRHHEFRQPMRMEAATCQRLARWLTDTPHDLDLYHHTDPQSASAIRESGRFHSEVPEEDERNGEPHAYFSTRENGSAAEDYGAGAYVHVRVPSAWAKFDDSTPSGEIFYGVPTRLIGPEHIIGTGRPGRHAAVTGEAADGPLYHGTPFAFAPGSTVDPGHDPSFGGREDVGEGQPAYMSSSPHAAGAWAEEAIEDRRARGQDVSGMRPRVYEVRPTGHFGIDESNRDEYTPSYTDYYSHSPLRVVREVPFDSSRAPWRRPGYAPGKPLRAESAARWAPSSGIFAPTTGLDGRLFNEQGSLRPAVHDAIMARLDRALRADAGLVDDAWREYLQVYLAGGSASEWAGSRPNEDAQDLDVLIGVDYESARSHSLALASMDDAQADAALNAALRAGFNETGWTPGFGGTWNLTGYVNHAAYDVRAIRPYAAYDVSGMSWAVRPPHLPGHALADFDPAVLAHARAVTAQARAILKMPEPLRSREAADLWAHVHQHRCVAFSSEGEGWQDPGNIDEKWLAYAPGGLLAKVRELALAKTGSKNGPLPDGIEFTHDVPRNRIIAHVPDASAPHHHALPAGRRQVGTLSWYEDPDRPGGSLVDYAWTDPDFQRRGVATELLGRARQLVPGLQHSIALSDDARKWISGMEGKTAALDGQDYWIGHRPPGPGHTTQSGRAAASVPYHEATGRHPDDLVSIYRAAPEDADAIHTGDWVSLHGDWTRERADSDPGYHVLHARVPARHVWLDAGERDDDEAGYHGPHVRAGAHNTASLANVEGMGGGGFTFEHRPGSHFEPHEVSARHPASPGDSILEPGEAGRIQWRPDTGEVVNVRVHDYFRRQGLGTEMWNRARAIDPGIRHSDTLSGDARQWIPRLGAHVPEDEPAVRHAGDLGWGDEQWATARREPWHAAAHLAQQEVRMSHPKATMEFPRGDEGDHMVSHLLRYEGYAGSRIEGAWAAPHPHPERGTSNPSWDADGFPGVVLHPERYDYGTVAHEAAHHVVLHNNGRGPNTPQTDEQVHGPEWAQAYALGLNRISRNAGDDFLYHHQRLHGVIQEGLRQRDPGALDAAESGLPPSRWIREGATEAAVSLEPAARPPTQAGAASTGWGWDPAPQPRGRGHDSRPLWMRQDGAVRDYLMRRNRHEDESEDEHRERRRVVRQYAPHRLKDEWPPKVIERYRDRALNGGPIGPDPYGSRYDPDEIDDDAPIDWGHEVIRHEAASGYTGLTKRSGMIYLDLPEDAVKHVPEGVDDHHITVVYLGKDVSDEAFAEACRRAKEAATQVAPLSGFLRGIEAFEPGDGSDEKVPAFVPAYLPGIGRLRGLLEDLNGSQHRQYRPHVTLAYLEPGEDLPAPHPRVDVSFDCLHVKRGDDIVSFPFGQPAAMPRVTATASGPWYHGSGKRYRPGDIIDPAVPHKTVHHQSDPSKVYFSDSLWNARNWANTASPSGRGHVYEVEPAGEHEEDPHYAGPEENGIYDLSSSPARRIDARQTGYPLRVVRRVPPGD